MEESVAFGVAGGYLDITASSGENSLLELSTGDAVSRLIKGGVETKNITFSSDGNGSMPSFNKQGEMTGLKVSPLDSVLGAAMEMLRQGDLPAQTVISFITSNPADHLKLTSKGRIQSGKDADILILDGHLKPKSVLAKGRLLMENGEILARGTFEQP